MKKLDTDFFSFPLFVDYFRFSPLKRKKEKKKKCCFCLSWSPTRYVRVHGSAHLSIIGVVLLCFYSNDGDVGQTNNQTKKRKKEKKTMYFTSLKNN